jgi:hypothetical protein
MGHGNFVKGTLAAAIVVASWSAVDGAAQQVQTQAPSSGSIVGAWTLNKDLSDEQPENSNSSGDQGQQRGSGSGGGGRRRGGGGGFGGGGGRGGRGGGGGFGQPTTDPEEAQRVRDAVRDLTNPPEHLTIVQTDSMVILTGPDGRATRLSTDGKKIKDDSTKLERKTKWDNGKLVSEIGGLPNGKLTQTLSVDAEHHLHITLQGENQRRKISVARVYDADAK